MTNCKSVVLCVPLMSFSFHSGYELGSVLTKTNVLVKMEQIVYQIRYGEVGKVLLVHDFTET